MDIMLFLSTYWRNLLELTLLAIAVYCGYLYFRETPGARAFMGVGGCFLAILLVSRLAHLEVIEGIVRSFSLFLALALVVIFQPELRRALVELGSNNPFFGAAAPKSEILALVTDACYTMADKRCGALIAFEREMKLTGIAETGVRLDSEFSVELAMTIFHPKTALHDGGVIVRRDRILAAGCIYPVTQRELSDRTLGLRHRAAYGLSEETDSVIVAVSEETGNVSLFHAGRMERDLSREELEHRLRALLFAHDEEEAESSGEEHADGDGTLADKTRRTGELSPSGSGIIRPGSGAMRRPVK